MSVDVRERLRRVLGPSRPAAPASHLVQDCAPAAPPAPRLDIEHLVPGQVHAGDLGSYFMAERRFPVDHVHGGETLGAFLGLADRALACLARHATLGPLDRRAVVFLDTETTGLSGGTGTYVFMVGLGFFDDRSFVVRQYFMRHHAEEPAMLAALGEELRRFAAVVTFNGKAFDLPLLQTRFMQSRLRPKLPIDPHLDVLHAARRFWRDRLDSCSLGTIEEAILGHARERDVPSWMIPELYFRYVRGGDVRPMARVFEHNLHDILSLAAVTCRLGRVLGTPTADAGVDDLFAVARLFEDLGFVDDACACYELALDIGRGTPIRRQVAARLAALCKRAGRFDRAVQLWRRLALASQATCEPHVELAKHYEWGTRDYAAAISVVEQALVVVQLREARRLPGVAGERTDLERRLARLLAKRRRSEAAGHGRDAIVVGSPADAPPPVSASIAGVDAAG